VPLAEQRTQRLICGKAEDKQRQGVVRAEAEETVQSVCYVDSRHKCNYNIGFEAGAVHKQGC
jgi:hypothetical protein